MDNEVHRSLGELHAKVDICLAELRDGKAERKDISDRISKLEHDHTALKAKAGIIATAAAGLVWFVERALSFYNGT